jgi:ABC-type sugar transport system ATPase subunit
MAEVRMAGIGKAFGDAVVLEGIDLHVAEGEFVVLVGASGCGKSTLLRLVAGLETITAGELRIGARRVNELPPAERKIAMVFQSYALYPHMNVAQNMAFGLRYAKVGKAEAGRRVRHAAEILRIDHLLGRKPRDLSGGQRQRVAIGRAIVREPDVFLFDEPLSNLDAALRASTRVEIAKLHRMLNATTIYVTHDQVEAMTLADRIAVMNAGRIEQVGRPMDLYEAPATRFVAGFIGSPTMNVFEVAPRDGVLAFEGGAARLPRSDAVKTIGVRPEHLRLGAADAAVVIRGEVELVERLGEVAHVHLRLGPERTAIVEARGSGLPAVGAVVAAGADAPLVHRFEADGRRLG